MIDKLSWGLATEDDRHDLSKFICGDESHPHVAEIHAYIRTRALDMLLSPFDPDADLRLITFRGEPGHRLVAVAAHTSNSRVADSEGELLPGTEIMLVAIALPVQGDRLEKRSLFDHIKRAVIADIMAANRGNLVAFLVHDDNSKLMDIARAAGVFAEQETLSQYTVFTTTV